MVRSFGHFNRVIMCLVLFELGPDQKLEETQDNSLKRLGQSAQISLDSAVLVVRPADIDKRRVQPSLISLMVSVDVKYHVYFAGGSHLDLAYSIGQGP